MAALALVAASPAHDLYVLASQSNMSGRGATAELSGAERLPDPRIPLYGNDGAWRPALDPLDDVAGQVDAASADTLVAVGPGLFFARALRSPRPVALVPCAEGGSALAEWRPGGGRDTPCGSCIARVGEADVANRLAGLLWYQGETDTTNAAATESWSARFAELVAAWRLDLAAPKLPIEAVVLAHKPPLAEGRDTYPAWARMQQSQRAPAMPGLATVSAEGLPRLSDGIHLTTAAQRALGARLATAMRTLQAPGCAASPAGRTS